MIAWVQAAGQVTQITQPDQGLFQAIGYHLLHGKILYADVFDHKPPAIYLLNAFYLLVGGHGENAVVYWIMFFVLLQTFVFWKLCNIIFENKLHAFFSTLIFIPIFFGKEIFGTGNFTEQYGVLCTTAALFFFLKFIFKNHTPSIFLAAFLLGFAPWFKEPFAFSAIPYVLYIVYLLFKKTISLKQFGLVIISCIIPTLIMLGYVGLSGSLEGFVENLKFSSNYATRREESILQRLWFNRNGIYFSLFQSVFYSFLISIPGIISLFLGKWKPGIVFLIAGQQICDWIATGMPGNWFAHYFLQTAPLSILMICMGIVWLGNVIKKRTQIHISIYLLFAIFLFSQYQWESWKSWRTNPEKRYFDAISRYLNVHEPKVPRHIVLASHDIGFYLPQSQGISHMRYVVPYPFHWIWLKGEIKNQRCAEDSIRLVQNPPPYIIYSGECATFFQDGHMDSFVLKNYHEVVRTQLSTEKTAILLKQNRP